MPPNQSTGLPISHALPANNRKKTMHTQNVQKLIPNTSQRDGAPGAVSSGVSSSDRLQKISVYWPTSKTIRIVLLTTVLATPFMVLVDMFFSRSHMPMQVAITLAIKLVIVGMIQFAVNEFMAGAFRLKLGNLNRKGVTPATNAKAGD